MSKKQDKLEVGDFVYSVRDTPDDNDQTVEFYEVLEVVGKKATVTPASLKVKSHKRQGDFLFEKVVPARNFGVEMAIPAKISRCMIGEYLTVGNRGYSKFTTPVDIVKGYGYGSDGRKYR